MRSIFYLILCFSISSCIVLDEPRYLQSEEVMLASPKMHIDSVFFKDCAIIKGIKPISEADIFWSNVAQGSENESIFEDSLKVDEDARLLFRADHLAYKESEITRLNCRQALVPYHLDTLSSLPKAPYNEQGLKILNDLKKASESYSDPAWIAFRSGTIYLGLDFGAPVFVERISLSTLIDINGWIFPPSSIMIQANSSTIIDSSKSTMFDYASPQNQFFDLTIADTLSKANIEIHMDSIPQGHPGQGTKPWFFIDEIAVR